MTSIAAMKSLNKSRRFFSYSGYGEYEGGHQTDVNTEKVVETDTKIAFISTHSPCSQPVELLNYPPRQDLQTIFAVARTAEGHSKVAVEYHHQQ
jgi:hypothetical protein